MSAAPSPRAHALRCLALVVLLAGAARAAADLLSIARADGAAVALPLAPLALAQAAALVLSACLPCALLLVVARGRRGAAPLRPLPALLAFATALLVALELWLRAFDAFKLPPGTPPAAALIRGPLVRAALTLAVGAPVLALLLRAALSALPSGFPSARLVARCALVLIVIAAALALVPPVLARLSDRTTRAARVARLDAPPNIVLIVLDTVRSDRISCYGFPTDATPEIDRLAREGTTFVNATSPAPWTLPAHASLFTGLYPTEHGAHYGHLRLDEDVTTMAELLKSLGYRTVGFSKKTWLSRGMGTLQGFEQYEDVRFPEPKRRLFAARVIASARTIRHGRVLRHADAGGDAIATGASAWIREHSEKRRDAPYFLFVNFNEAHLPFIPPRPYFLRYAARVPGREAMIANLDPLPYIAGELPLGAEDVELLRALYAGEIAYVDRLIARIVDAVDASGALERTLIVVTSDHGENIADHDLMGHVLCLYDTLLRIPLVVRYPARFPAGTLDERFVQLTDLLPTIVDLVDSSAIDLLPPLSGESLLSASDRGFSIAEYQRPDDYLDQFAPRFPGFDTAPYRRDLVALSAGTLKLIEGSDGRRELFDLAADPAERRNLAAADTTRARDLAGALARFRDGLRARGARGDAPQIDDATREELRSLGYIQ